MRKIRKHYRKKQLPKYEREREWSQNILSCSRASLSVERDRYLDILIFINRTVDAERSGRDSLNCFTTNVSARRKLHFRRVSARSPARPTETNEKHNFASGEKQLYNMAKKLYVIFVLFRFP